MGALRHKTAYSILLQNEQLAALRALSDQTRIPLQVLAREGIDLVLAKHAKSTKKKEAR